MEIILVSEKDTPNHCSDCYVYLALALSQGSRNHVKCPSCGYDHIIEGYKEM